MEDTQTFENQLPSPDLKFKAHHLATMDTTPGMQGPSDQEKLAPLFEAINTNDVDKVVALLETLGTGELNAPGPDGLPALLLAAKKGYNKIVKALLNLEGSNTEKRPATPEIAVDITDFTKWNALHYAACFGHLAVMKELFKLDETAIQRLVTMKDRYDSTPISIAISKKHVEAVKIILPKLARNDAVLNRGDDSDKDSLLVEAVSTGNTEIVRILMTTPGVNPDKVCGTGEPGTPNEAMTALQLAKSRKLSSDLIDVLEGPRKYRVS